MRKHTGRLSLLLDLLTTVALLLVLGSFARRELAQRDSGAVAPAASTSGLVGKDLTRIDAVDATGADAAIEARGAAHLLLLFRSDCPACAQQRPAWIELARAARERGAHVFGVTNEPLTPGVVDYLAEAGVEVRRMQPQGQLAALGVGLVPTTLLVAPGGRILDAAIGVRSDFEAMLDAVGAPSGK